jgi:hypothetical protein
LNVLSEKSRGSFICFLRPSRFCLASPPEAPAPGRLVNHCIGSNPNAGFQFDLDRWPFQAPATGVAQRSPAGT